jgi:acyl transferase domain-containing protein
MDGRGDRGESAAIIGMACRFPGARDPAEFHDLAVAGRDMFQPWLLCRAAR